MDNCDTCQFWRCYRLNSEGYGTCHSDKFKSGSEAGAKEDDGVRYGGADGYGDFFEVGPKFGCIHHRHNHPAPPPEGTGHFHEQPV